MDIGKSKYSRTCPKCSTTLTYKWKQLFVKTERTNQTCYRCRPSYWQGKTHTEETKPEHSFLLIKKNVNQRQRNYSVVS
jgi:uncharacterized protein with PIN domain